MSENKTQSDDSAYLPEDDASISEFDLTPSGEEPTPPEQGRSADEGGGDGLVDERFKELQAERDELEAKLLRTAADYQNFTRRAQANVEAARQETLMKVARSLVEVLDNFDRALDIDPQKTTVADVQNGVQSIQSSLLQALERFGMKKISVEPGSEFDPNLHEALMRQPSEDHPSNTIVMQLLPGYLLKDQPVRPAQVSVAE